MASLSKPPAAALPSTLQRIPTGQLRPGMFLVRVLDSWWKSPFFVHRRLLNSRIDVEQLMSSGIREVEIDTSLGVGVSSEGEAEVEVNPLEETEIPIVSSYQEDSDGDSKNSIYLGQESSSLVLRPKQAQRNRRTEKKSFSCVRRSSRRWKGPLRV